MLTVPGLAVRNLRHRRVRTMFLAALVLILSAALFTSRVLTESMKTCIDKTVDRITGALPGTAQTSRLLKPGTDTWLILHRRCAIR